MKSSIIKRIFAILLISFLSLQDILGQRDDFQLKLGEIDTPDVQLRALENNEYAIKVSQYNGELLEKVAVERSDSQDPVITKKGRVIVYYPKNNLNLVWNYNADSKGYGASYRLEKVTEPFEFGVRLNIKDLKSLTG